jgi:hypothetical protein
MSADNIGYCPQCIKDGRIFWDTTKTRFELATRTCGPINTLREEWGLQMTSNGYLKIEYKCRCSECDFEYKCYIVKKAVLT